MASIDQEIEDAIAQIVADFKTYEKEVLHILRSFPDAWHSEKVFQIRYLRTFHIKTPIGDLPNMWTIHRARYSVIRKLKDRNIYLGMPENEESRLQKRIKSEGIKRAVMDREIG